MCTYISLDTSEINVSNAREMDALNTCETNIISLLLGPFPYVVHI